MTVFFKKLLTILTVDVKIAPLSADVAELVDAQD